MQLSHQNIGVLHKYCFVGQNWLLWLYNNHKKLFGHVLCKWTMAYLQKIGSWHPWLCATANYSEKVCAKALETNLKGGLHLSCKIMQELTGDWKEWVCLRERTAGVCSLTPAEQEMPTFIVLKLNKQELVRRGLGTKLISEMEKPI